MLKLHEPVGREGGTRDRDDDDGRHHGDGHGHGFATERGANGGAAPGRAWDVVLLNPFPFDRGFWDENLPAFRAAGHRVHTTDYAGLVRHDAEDARPAAAAPPPSELSIDGIAEALVGALHARALERVALVGLSMGGYVALSVAARFPGAVGALVLADTRAAADSPAARAGRDAALSTIADPVAGVDRYLASSLPKLLRPHPPADLPARVRALAVERADALARGVRALRDRPDRAEDLERLRIPALVVVGAEDGVVSPGEMRAMADAIPGCRFARIAGAGHLSSLEQPEAFHRVTLDFLGSLA